MSRHGRGVAFCVGRDTAKPVVVGGDVARASVKDHIARRLACDPERPSAVAGLCTVLGSVVEDEIALVSSRTILNVSRVVAGTIKDETVGELVLLLGGVVDVDMKLMLLLINDREGQVGDVDTISVASVTSEGELGGEAMLRLLRLADELVAWTLGHVEGRGDGGRRAIVVGVS